MKLASQSFVSVMSVALIGLLGGACDDTARGEEDALPADLEDGKYDAARQPVGHGALAANDGHVFATISEDERYHSWIVTLSGPAVLTIDTNIGGFGKQVDTVLYLYEVGVGGYLTKNDNAKSSVRFSRIEEELEAGEYRVVVKGKYTDTVGDIIVSAYCEGDGCEGSAPAGDWLEVLKATYAEEGSEAFEEVGYDDAPKAIQRVVTDIEDQYAGEDYTTAIYGWDTDEGTAHIVELRTDAAVVVQIFDPEGTLAASGYATESDLLRWD